MRIPFLKGLLAAFLCCLAWSPLQAQNGKYLIAAQLKINAADTTLLWVNGHQIFSIEPETSPDNQIQSKDFLRDDLCWFGTNNILTFILEQHVEQYQNLLPTDKVGIGYILRLTFSDHTEKVITSDEVTQHVNLTVPKGQPEPAGWQAMDYNDSSWQPSELAPPNNMVKVPMDSPLTHKELMYLSAYGATDTRQTLGQKRFFRRKIPLQIDFNPECPQPRRPPPTATPIPPPPRPTPTPLPLLPTPTPRPIPPTPTPRPIPTPRPLPTLIPTPTPLPPLEPTATPTHIIPHPPTATPLPEVPTPTFTPEIVFVPTHQINFVPPVYIWVDFSGAADASAAGDECLYRLEIVDSGRTHVRTLFSKKVTTDSQRWMEWDGKDDQGQLMQPGNYYAIFSKDGEARPPVALHWWPANPDQ